ncbi:hypothetical protein JTB14_011514 [Gonioctena quinquepunctata]|nr:hypothetical protein JTB14_011514 [Gonioctena quinquepunctata]
MKTKYMVLSISMVDGVVQLVFIDALEDVEQRDRRRYRQRGDPFTDLSDKQFAKELVPFVIDMIAEYITPANRAQDLDISTKEVCMLDQVVLL